MQSHYRLRKRTWDAGRPKLSRIGARAVFVKIPIEWWPLIQDRAGGNVSAYLRKIIGKAIHSSNKQSV
jgi:hypothetical protein